MPENPEVAQDWNGGVLRWGHVHFKPGKGMQARLNRRKPEPESEAEVQRLLRAS